MKIIFKLSIIFLIYNCLSCSESRDKMAVSLIKKSIEAHGGQNSWESLQSFSMKKESRLFKENGETESFSIQDNEFRLKPFFEAKMTWEKDSIHHRLIFDGITTRYWMGENEIKNEGFLESKKKDIDAAYYVMTKPFDLLGSEKNLTYLGLTHLPDGKAVETVQVIDGDPHDATTDIWWYFLDPETFRLVAYKVKTSDHYSLVYNLDWDNSTGILFPTKRESYRVDSLGNHLYLRAAYSYGDYK